MEVYRPEVRDITDPTALDRQNKKTEAQYSPIPVGLVNKRFITSIKHQDFYRYERKGKG